MNAPRDGGFVLIAALWLLAALAALASAYSVYAVETAPSAALPEKRLQAQAALRAGVELCAYRQLAWPKPDRPDAGAFSAQVGASRVDVVYQSESARVDLNQAPREVLSGLFQQLGARATIAGYVADRIVAWRGPLTDDARRQEETIYTKAGLAYGPLGAAFDNALEIALLPGVSGALVARALPFVTVFGGAKVDPLVADPLVLAALPGMTAETTAALLRARNGARPDAAAVERLAATAKDFVGLDPNDYVRAEIVASLAGRQTHAEVVLKLLEKVNAPFEILFWRDDFDGG